MDDNFDFTERLLIKQRSMFRQAAKQGFTQDLIHGETKLPTSSLSEWACGKTKISFVAVLKLSAMPDFPASLISLLFEGTGKHVADDKDNSPDLDELAVHSSGFTAEYVEAKSDGVVTPIERERLTARARKMALKAKSVAA